MRRRLDAELVRRGLARSRAEAVEAIRDGRVTVGGAPANNPARQVSDGDAIERGGPPRQFVSRGGLKLAAALDGFAIDPAGRTWLDAGASTGGFTDCLLQRGAACVYAVDVGRGQLAWALQQDPRVVVRDRTNVRHLDAETLGAQVGGCVADLSFISLRTVAPALVACAAADADFVLLVKPQFEAGRARVGKGGVIRDTEVHVAVLAEVAAGLAGAGLVVVGALESPVRGADGNREFLFHARSAVAPATGAFGRAAIDEAALVALARSVPQTNDPPVPGPSGENAP